MKWMIASDIHGSALYREKTPPAFRREAADRLLLLGDLLYHGPRNDLPEAYAPKGGHCPAQRDEKVSGVLCGVRPRWTRWFCPSRCWLDYVCWSKRAM